MAMYLYLTNGLYNDFKFKMNLSAIKKKLKFQAWHRGTRENDLLLGAYADVRLPDFSDSQLWLFEKLLNESDLDIFGWIVHKLEPLDIYQDLIRDIMHYHDKK